ncbi:clotting factor B-like [Ischnura elegans]|uniref:clotting factor B-like n=1 Tax=Ischnura elegans TaxID=197161 RepID=UPI001ED87F6B|nr:clotting factor B-like [Ischnura elegans]
MMLVFWFLLPLLGVQTDAQGFFGWYGGQESYEQYRDYYDGETEGPRGGDAVELLSCSDYNGEPTTCTPITSCPQLRYSQKQQFCMLSPNTQGVYGNQGVAHICCPKSNTEPPKKASNRPVSSIPTLGSRKNAGRVPPRNQPKTVRPSFQPFLDPDAEILPRVGGGGPASNSGCGLLERDEIGRLETRRRYSSERQQILGAAIGGVSLSSSAESPWTVAIGEYTNQGTVDWYCGGSLLSQYSVLTAAHCTKRRRPEVARVGEVDLRRDTRLGEGKGEEVRVSDVHVHPNYRSPSTYNDVAVLTLQRPVDISRPGGARPICLPPASNSNGETSVKSYAGERAKLTGWGHLFFGGDKSPILQEVTVTVLENNDCSKSYSAPSIAAGVRRSYPSGIVNSQLCAGDRQGKKDACQGDSGGPLVVKGRDKKHVIIGVISSGIGCGSKQYPGVYARVSSFVDWISSKIVS